MTKRAMMAAGAAAFVIGAGPALAGEELEPTWNNGLRLVSEDGSVSLRIGGRIQYDVTFQEGNDQLIADLGEPLEDGHEFRRIRFYMSGVFDDRTEFKAQLDFAGGKAKAKDVWIGLRNLPVLGRLLIGNMYEPQGFDALTSDKYTMFVEKSLPSVLVYERRTGVRATNQFGMVWASVMASRNSDSFGSASGDGEYNYIGRIVMAPINEDGGRRLLHLGASVSLRNPGGEIAWSAPPENHLAPDYISTGALSSDDTVVWGVEAAGTWEQFTLQGEFVQSRVEGRGTRADATFDGWYVQGSWFLTGEYRPYDFGDDATFVRPLPRNDYGEGGWGAWEVAARWSTLDLNDRDAQVAGGKLDDFTLGLNWYQSPTFRWMANYIHADLEGSGSSHAALFRVATDF